MFLGGVENFRFGIAVPKNLEYPFYVNIAYNPAGVDWVDVGLGGYLETAYPEYATSEMGRMKAPTLRNVDKQPSAGFVKAYGHNGYFKSPTDVVRFFASRGMMGGGGMMCGGTSFPAPEVNENLATLNHFRCNDQSYIVTFLKTLSDGYFQR